MEKGKVSTLPEHIAPSKISGMERGAWHLLRKVQLIGPQSARWAEEAIAEQGVAGMRIIQGLLSITLKKLLDHERLIRERVDNANSGAIEIGASIRAVPDVDGERSGGRQRCEDNKADRRCGESSKSGSSTEFQLALEPLQPAFPPIQVIRAARNDATSETAIAAVIPAFHTAGQIKNRNRLCRPELVTLGRRHVGDLSRHHYSKETWANEAIEPECFAPVGIGGSSLKNLYIPGGRDVAVSEAK